MDGWYERYNFFSIVQTRNKHSLFKVSIIKIFLLKNAQFNFSSRFPRDVIESALMNSSNSIEPSCKHVEENKEKKEKCYSKKYFQILKRIFIPWLASAAFYCKCFQIQTQISQFSYVNMYQHRMCVLYHVTNLSCAKGSWGIVYKLCHTLIKYEIFH
jgi:hypothetical protein